MIITIDFGDGDDTAVLGIKGNKLYWNDKEIMTELSLNRTVNVSIVVGAISTLTIAIVRVLTYLQV